MTTKTQSAMRTTNQQDKRAMTAKARERKAAELGELLTAHRLIRADLHTDVHECYAHNDMPELWINKGDAFYLAKSSFEGYAYVVTAGDYGLVCGCKGYEFNHGTCKHTKSVAALTVTKHHKGTVVEQAIAVVESVEPEIGYCQCCGKLSKRDICGWCA